MSEKIGVLVEADFVCLGEFSNSYVLAKCKVRTHGSFMFLRFVLSTLVGQFIDSATFVVWLFLEECRRARWSWWR
jgi:uncharacterized PurR-regulated membrane protein YhhQ (DUF165 family)